MLWPEGQARTSIFLICDKGAARVCPICLESVTKCQLLTTHCGSGWPEFRPTGPGLEGPGLDVRQKMPLHLAQRHSVFGDELPEAALALIYYYSLDLPGRRFRNGYAAELTFTHQLGLFRESEPLSQSVNTKDEELVDQRFRTLAQYANQLVDDLGGASLSPETLAIDHPVDRWLLTVHELTAPARHAIRGTTAIYEKVSDVFLASAIAVRKLLDAASGAPRPTPPLNKNAVAILCCLNKHFPALLTQYDVVDATRLSRNTVRDVLEYLRCAGLAYRPQGKRKGDTVTDAGRALAQSLSAAHH
jgi:hypothetical protein